MSSWRLRWLILSPVALFVMGTLVVSCGGGGGCSGVFDAFGNFVPGFCPTPGAGPGFNLESITICEGSPTMPTPTPTSSAGTHSATPTATPCPMATTTSVPVGPQIAFHADGLFVKKQKMITVDITRSLSTLWTSTNSAALQPPTSSSNGGVYQPVSPGCACVDASSGGISALPVGVVVFSNSAPTPSCGECPTPVPTPTPSPGAVSTASAAQPAQPANSHARLNGVLQWTFDPLMPLAGPIAASTGGNLYFMTVDGSLHALNANGRELWRRNSGGENVAVDADQTVYAMSHDGRLEALSPHGRPLWKMQIDSPRGPLGAANGTVYLQSGNYLVAVTAPGLEQWRASLPGEIASLAITDSGLVVAGTTGGSVVAIDKNGMQRWSFAPAGGFAGTVAARADTVYAGSGAGTVYALDASNGSQQWHYDSAAPVAGGPVVNDDGVVFFASDATYALGSDGQLMWTKFRPPSSNAAAVTSGGAGVLAPTSGGFTALLNADGTLRWATGSFGAVQSTTLGPSGTLYVVTSGGRIFTLR